MLYYVISSPPQVLPLYIVKYSTSKAAPQNSELMKVLCSNHWTTVKEADIVPVPRNRKCLMSRTTATVLWIGFLHAHLSDSVLERDEAEGGFANEGDQRH